MWSFVQRSLHLYSLAYYSILLYVDASGTGFTPEWPYLTTAATATSTSILWAPPWWPWPAGFVSLKTRVCYHVLWRDNWSVQGAAVNNQKSKSLKVKKIVGLILLHWDDFEPSLKDSFPQIFLRVAKAHNILLSRVVSPLETGQFAMGWWGLNRLANKVDFGNVVKSEIFVLRNLTISCKANWKSRGILRHKILKVFLNSLVWNFAHSFQKDKKAVHEICETFRTVKL
jgi:hypothetical protein